MVLVPRRPVVAALVVALGVSCASRTLAADLTGVWRDDNGSRYRIRQVGPEIYWYMDGAHGALNVFYGILAGNMVTGKWADVPEGESRGTGQLALRVEDGSRFVKVGQSRPYGGSVWIRQEGFTSGATGSGPGSVPPQLAQAPMSMSAQVTGVWSVVCCGGKYRGRTELWQNGDQISGRTLDTSSNPTGDLQGHVRGREVRFAWRGSTGLRQEQVLTLDDTGDRMSGTISGDRDTSVGDEIIYERITQGPAVSTAAAVGAAEWRFVFDRVEAKTDFDSNTELRRQHCFDLDVQRRRFLWRDEGEYEMTWDAPPAEITAADVVLRFSGRVLRAPQHSLGAGIALWTGPTGSFDASASPPPPDPTSGVVGRAGAGRSGSSGQIYQGTTEARLRARLPAPSDPAESHRDQAAWINYSSSCVSVTYHYHLVKRGRPVASDSLGIRWDERENYGHPGVWTRRGTSNVFDADWIGVRAVLTISIQGRQVSVARRQSSDGNDCDYVGTLAENGTTVSGTYRCTKYPGPYSWEATIHR